MLRLAMQVETIKGDLETEENKNDELVRQIMESQEENRRITEKLQEATAELEDLR